jgi:hypothetical protein
METKKTYTVVVKTTTSNTEVHLQVFYCEMMAINYIEHEYHDDAIHGEAGDYQYYINNERYI